MASSICLWCTYVHFIHLYCMWFMFTVHLPVLHGTYMYVLHPLVQYVVHVHTFSTCLVYCVCTQFIHSFEVNVSTFLDFCVLVLLYSTCSHLVCINTYWYMPIILSCAPEHCRPLWVEFTKDVNTYGMDDQCLIGKVKTNCSLLDSLNIISYYLLLFSIGNSLLVKPVTKEGVASVDIYFPGTATVSVCV